MGELSPTHILSGTSETEFALFLSNATQNCGRCDRHATLDSIQRRVSCL